MDLNPAMVAAARGRYPGIDVRAAAAADLPLGDGQAHGYQADKVYHVLPDPHAALAEARRVLVPGGRIVLVGQDWDTVVIDSDQPELTRRIVHARAGAITGDEADNWVSEQTRRARDDRLLVALPMFLAAGTR